MKNLCESRIDLSAIGFNIEQIRKKIGDSVKIMAVVKADAYGHGAETVATYLQKKGIDRFAVAQVYEAIRLRKAGVKGTILVLQPCYHADRQSYYEHNLDCIINGAQDLEGWREDASVNGHLFVDTGMGREGVMPDQFETMLEKIDKLPGLSLAGVGTHFSSADEEDLGFARRQLAAFNDLVSAIPAQIRSRITIHAANSGATINLPDSHMDMVRPGIWMYGQYTGSGDFEQKPAMSVFGMLTSIKQVPKGWKVGYGGVYVTPGPTRLAIVSAGYADGYTRIKSGSAQVSIRNRTFPVVGRVSMDAIIVDIGLDNDVEMGDEVLIFGGEDPPFSIAHDAAELSTISYERCCQLGLRFPKVYLNP